MFEEIAQKKKWRNVQKDPSRTLKDQNTDTTQYWQLLNNLPQKGVDRIVTKLVLNADN